MGYRQQYSKAYNWALKDMAMNCVRYYPGSNKRDYRIRPSDKEAAKIWAHFNWKKF